MEFFSLFLAFCLWIFEKMCYMLLLHVKNRPVLDLLCVGMCMCEFCKVWVCMCGFCNVWVCVCVGVCMCGFCNVWVCVCVGVCMCGFCNVWVCGLCNV